MGGVRLAEIGYSEKYSRVELVLPYGTKAADLAKFGERLFGDFILKLPRGCQACLSGEPFFIRERLEHVLNVDLDRMEIVNEIRGG